MSNFDFLDDPKFLSDPACAMMYKNARIAESTFRSWPEVCALYARQTLEDFCAFVSELKGAVYPEKKNSKMLGWYWCDRNEAEFIRIVGYDNYRLVRTVNCTARSYIHSHGSRGPVRDDYYPELLQDLYKLLLWLYKELGLKTTRRPGDYSPSRIPKGDAPTAVWSTAELEPAPERTLRQLKKAFPNCNTEGLCSVERDGDHYIVRDLYGSQVGELAAPEALEYSQEEVRRLKTQMDDVTREFERVQEELNQLVQDKDERISRLEETVDRADRNRMELTASQNRETDALRKEIRRLERTKEELTKTYQKKLRVLGDRFSILDDKYQALLPVEEQRDELRRLVKAQLERQAAIERDFSQKQDALLSEIADARRRLAEAQTRIRQMDDSEASSQALIAQLRGELDEKETKLRAAQKEVRESARLRQKETEDVLRQRGEQPGGLEAAEAAAIRGTARIQAAIASYDREDQVDGYLRLTNQGLAEIDRGMTLYDRDAEKLRRFFEQVKRYYEQQIADLKDQLAQKEREREQERRRYEAMFNAVTIEETPAPSREKHSVHEKRSGRPALALCLLLVLGLSGYTAVNQWRLRNELGAILSQEDTKNPEYPEDAGVVPDEAPAEDDQEPREPEPPMETDTYPPKGPDASEEGAPEGQAAVEEGVPEEADRETESLPRPTVGAEEKPVPGEDVSVHAEPTSPEPAPAKPASLEPAPAKSALTESTPGKPAGEVTSAEEAEAALDAMRENYEKTETLNGIEEIPGVSAKLLEELKSIDQGILQQAIWNEEVEDLGKTELPYVTGTGSSTAFNACNLDLTGSHSMVRYSEYEAVRFAYYGFNKWHPAVEISDLCSSLSRGSTQEEVTRALRAPKVSERYDFPRPTSLTDAQSEYGVVFMYPSGAHRRCMVCFDGNDQVCDYVILQ